MSDLENRSKPLLKTLILQRSPFKLQAPDLAILAAFGFKNAAVADHMQVARPPFFWQSDCRSFAATLKPPEGLQMWLATMTLQHGLFNNYYVSSPVSPAKSFEGHIFTYGAGHLVIQVAAWRWRKKARRKDYAPPFANQAEIWNAYSTLFWPSDGTEINWPPIAHLSDRMVHRFIGRWSEARATVLG